jgi:Mce-associated membrane protein
MATKIFKGRNSGDVFDKLADKDDSGAEAPSSDDEAVEAVEPDVVDDDGGDAVGSDDVHDAAVDAVGEEAREVVASPPERRVWLRRALAGAVGAAIVAVLVASGWLAWEFKQQKDIDAASSAALAAAQSYGVLLTSIDTDRIDENFTQVLNGATGQFKDMYSQSANQLRQVLIDNKAMSKGTVIDSAVKSATKAKVEVLLFIDQSISNKVNPDPRIDRNRVAMTMELIDNRWLASQVDIM